MVYHALAVTLSLFITYLIFYFADNGANLEFKFIDDSKSFQVISYYISGTTLLLLFYLAKCLKLFLSYRSSEFNSLLLATLTLCFCTIFGIIIPQALRVSGVHTGNSYKDVVDCIIVSAGIFSPLARLIDKNLLQALRGKKKVNREIEETIQIRNMNSFLISDILEDVQKTVILIQIVVLVTLSLSAPTYQKKIWKRTHIFEKEKIDWFKKFLPSSFTRKLYSKKLGIYEYYPQEFATLRAKLGYSGLVESLKSELTYKKLYNLINEEGGRSDAFIFSTYDQKFIIKTITSSEAAFFLRSLLENYLKRIMNFPKSKLARIVGVYKIKPKNQFVIIMESLITNKKNSVIFDLKGSKLDRFVEGIDNPLEPPFGIVLKDENFRLFGKKIYVGECRKKEILDVLRDDIFLLEKAGITDYSVLVSIFESKSENLSRCTEEMESGKSFNVGIIDFLGQFGLKKLGEQKLKSLLNKKNDISASSPIDYSKRLISSVENYFA